MEREVLLTGIGGQGIQLAAQVLARGAVAAGLEAMLFGSYGGTMRGGPTDATVVIADAPITAPPIVSRASAALAMHPAGWPAVAAKLARDAVVLRNAPLFEDGDEIGSWHLHDLDATALATEQGSALAAALVLVGAFAATTRLLSCDALCAGLSAALPERRQKLREVNERALRAGFAALPTDGGAA